MPSTACYDIISKVVLYIEVVFGKGLHVLILIFLWILYSY